MKNFLYTLIVFIAFTTVSCNKDNTEDTGNGELAAPAVSFKDITSTSFTAEWPAINGADSYRYEITYHKDGRTVAVAAGNITETEFSLNALKPATEYIVRVVAKSGEKMSVNWYNGKVTTAGNADIEFTVTPYEAYYKKEGYVYPYAQVEVSNQDIYYWVSAIPANNKDNAKEWIEQDIAYYLEMGITWEELVEEKLILKGNGDSSPFIFKGYDHYYFIVAAVEKNMNGIGISSAPTFSHQFWNIGTDVSTVYHEGKYEDYIGDWVVQTNGTVWHPSPDSPLDIKEGESFPVRIAATANKQSLELTGWGGSRNRFNNSPIILDFEPSEENDDYNRISISFPQPIKTEKDIEWKYVSWYNFAAKGEDGENKVHYLPFDDKMAENMPSWKKGFSGFIGNLNKTVIKIFPEDYTDPMTGEGAAMMSIWPYGISSTGDISKDKFLNGVYEEPVGFYFLVRKDVADGMKLELPETTANAIKTSTMTTTAFKQNISTNKENRPFSRPYDKNI